MPDGARWRAVFVGTCRVKLDDAGWYGRLRVYVGSAWCWVLHGVAVCYVVVRYGSEMVRNVLGVACNGAG